MGMAQHKQREKLFRIIIVGIHEENGLWFAMCHQIPVETLPKNLLCTVKTCKTQLTEAGETRTTGSPVSIGYDTVVKSLRRGNISKPTSSRARKERSDGK